MAESFASELTIKVDGSPLDEAITPLLEELIIDDDLHNPDMIVLVLRDAERDVLAKAGIKIGSRLTVAASGIGDRGDDEPLFNGEVTAIEADYSEAGSRAVTRGYDPSHRLHRGRHTKSYVEMKDSDIARAIAQRAGLEIGTIDDSGPVQPHISQANASDWDFLVRRAMEIGFEIGVDDGKFDFRKPARPDGAPSEGDYTSDDPLQLVFGQELIEFHPRLTASGQVEEVIVRGWDAKQKQALVGRAAASAASATLTETPGGLAGAFGHPTHVTVDRPLNSQAEVDATAKAIAERIGSGYAEATGIALGNPKLRAGAQVSVGVVGDAFSGKYVVTSARHIIGPGGYRTHFTVSGRLDRSLLGLADRSASGPTQQLRIPGVVPAIVTNNDDPDKLARVKVKFPWLDDHYESFWARIAAPGAGPDSGVIFVPEVNDEVLVAFELGDIQRPYVVGGLWNGLDKPRLGDSLVRNGKVERRGIVSRKGHRAVFLDAPGKAGIALITSDDKLKIALKETGTEIHVQSDGTILIESTRDITVKGSANIKVEANGQLTLKGQGGVKIESGGVVDVDGSLIQLN